MGVVQIMCILHSIKCIWLTLLTKTTQTRHSNYSTIEKLTQVQLNMNNMFQWGQLKMNSSESSFGPLWMTRMSTMQTTEGYPHVAKKFRRIVFLNDHDLN